MAWRFRRSLKIGPLRLNFSKSGVGYSAGVRGFRVGQDAKGRTYTAASIPGTGLYNRQYSGASKPIGQSAASLTSAPLQSGTGNGLKLFIAFMLGGVVFSIIGAMMSSSPAAPPAPPPAAVIAPIAPPPVTLRSGALMVQREQALQAFRIRQRRGPAIRRKHRLIQLPKRLRPPPKANRLCGPPLRRLGVLSAVTEA
jgi:hypothetical protein